MTIPSFCIDLLRAHGPLTIDELAAAAAAAGATTARDPAVSVTNALRGKPAVVTSAARVHLVAHVIEGRWLTTTTPIEPRGFFPGLDLAVLARFDHGRVPLARGGALCAAASGQAWSGPADWLPEGVEPGALLGLRLWDGVLEVCPVELDDQAARHGQQLADLVRARSAFGNGYVFDHLAELTGALLDVLTAEDGLLREPVAPLSTLIPVQQQRPAPRPPWAPPYFRDVMLSLPPAVHQTLTDAAEDEGRDLEMWLSGEVVRLVDWPKRSDDPALLARPWGYRYADDPYGEERFADDDYLTPPISFDRHRLG